MSKVQLQGNVSGTGVFTIASPNSNVDRTITLPDNTGTVLTTASNLSGLAGVGKILQVVQTVKTDTFSASNAGDTAITGLSASIIPSSTSSRILIMYSVNYDSNRGNSGGGFRIYRGGTMLSAANGQAAGNRYTVNADFGANANADQSMLSRSFSYIDSPSSTSSLTYQVYQYQDTNTFTTFINRSRQDNNDGDDPRTASTITLMEIGA